MTTEADWLFSAEFARQYDYDGPLGVVYHQAATTFHLWAPTATQVWVRLYSDAQPATEGFSQFGLTAGRNGSWQLTLHEDLAGVVYTYVLRFADGTQTETIDPYATAAIVNGTRGVILPSPAPVAPLPPFHGRASIMEVSIRDFSSHPASGIRHRGQYLGLTEVGTKTPTGATSGLDYLKQSGVTHVQLMPFFDFATVDETAPGRDYNWGYDPQNYNVPEGSFATAPADPQTRISEAQAMVTALHAAGLRVIMDVVYNHVYDPRAQALALTVPGYYFRQHEGQLSDGTGTGNDLASEQPMARRYIVDSVRYWAETYGVDGFRFDLMGSLDVTTMQAVAAALPNLLLLGEGWPMATPLPATQQTTPAQATAVPSIGFFNDGLRDLIKGDNFVAAAPGFVTGTTGNEWALVAELLAGMTVGPAPYSPESISGAHGRYAWPQQAIQYVSVHDNLTLYDKLVATNPADDAATREARVRLALLMVALSQGVPFFPLGATGLRTKGGDANSYRSGDNVNAIDWNRLGRHRELNQLIARVLIWRAAQPEWQAQSYPELAALYRGSDIQPGVIASRLGALWIAFNARQAAVTQWAPAGTVLLSGTAFAPAGLATHAGGDYSILPLSAVILREKS